MSVRAAPQVGLNVEYILWVFLRISGLFMWIFAFLGIAGAFWMQARMYFQTGGFVDIGALARWAFFPISTHVTAYVPAEAGWAHVWWQIMQYLMLFFAVSHGLDGLRQVLEDFVGHSWLRLLVRSLLFVAWMVIIIVGWLLIQGNLPA